MSGQEGEGRKEKGWTNMETSSTSLLFGGEITECRSQLFLGSSPRRPPPGDGPFFTPPHTHP